jgi:hypothetical protein
MVKKYSIFHLEGGLGKHIAATAVAKCIKNNFPDRELIIVSAWPQIFINLPFVDKVYRIGHTPYFYKDYIENQDSLIFKHEPYFTTSHIHKQKSLIENWCELYNLEYNFEQPELKFNLIEKYKSGLGYKYDKPPLVIHSNGGMFQPENSLPYRWTRDMPFPLVQALTNVFAQKYTVFQVARPNSLIANGAVPINQALDIMEYLSILLHSQKRILIDSSLQHAAKALNLPSTVLWVGTSPKVFGYDIHHNIQATVPVNPQLPDSYLFDYNFDGLAYEYPYGESDDIFDIEKIIQSVNNQ